ncbi:MAG: hemolysin family protein [Pseudorhodoplanes sp.]|nr:HlyC/CorC family transporter [Pseudorhodoplanes sp.]MCL4710856.1 hemolysin family protein [Pseudorhodoplanes sp.]MCQ3942248.1 HlyC/CorC family transporter [Alphaproteobacteria bacterium]
MTVWLELAIVVGLILLNGFFAMAEMAVVSSRRIRLQHMAESGSRGAALALKLSENPARFLSAVQVGITLIGILSGAFGGATLGARLGEILNGFPAINPRGPQAAFILVVIAITALSVIVGEIVPKRIALLYSERIAAMLSRPLQGIVVLARPLVWILENTTALLLRIVRIPQEGPDRVTEEEVRLAIAEGTEAGAIAPVEKELLHGVLALADNPVTSAMTPRPDIYWIDLDNDPRTIADDIAECPYSRMVVVRGGDIGHPLGVVQKKDLANDLLAGDKINIEKHMLEPTYVPEHVSVLRMLEIFKATPLHIAFVVDEYGDFLGLITLTDILGAVAGHLPQEHETDGQHIRRRKDGTLLVDGRTSVEELANALGLAVKGVDFHTAAGLALDRLARIPSEGDAFMLEGWRIEVIDMDGKRVDKLLFVPPQVEDNA